MVEIKCRTIPEPKEGTRPIYRKRNDDDNKSNNTSSLNEPFIQGHPGGELDYVCGSCKKVLAENVSQGEITTDIVFQCPRCQAYNEVYNVMPSPAT
jgi:phage FluMu protein Com